MTPPYDAAPATAEYFVGSSDRINIPRAALGCAIAILGVLAALAFVNVLLALKLHVPLGHNEGWNAYHTASWLAGGPLYPSAPSLMFNNYPPLSFLIVGALSHVVGDVILAGRMLSLLGTLAAAGAIAVAALRMGCTRLEAVLGGLLTFAGLSILSSYVGMDDPQLMAHGIGCTGFAVMLYRPRSQWRIAGAALLLTAACFTKHMLIVQPLALFIWLAIYERRSAMLFAAFGLGFAFFGLLCTNLVFHTDLLAEIASARGYNVAQALHRLMTVAPEGCLAFFASLYLLRDLRDRHAVLGVLYLWLAFAFGLYFAGGDGVVGNCLFDTALAIALCLCVAINRLRATGEETSARRSAGVIGLLLVSVLPIVFTLVAKQSDARYIPSPWTPYAAQRPLAATDIAFLRAQKGPALCEMLALCYWAGKPAEVDAFNAMEAFAQGTRDPDELVQRLDRHYYSALQFDQETRFARSPQIMAAIRRDYRIAFLDEYGAWLLPRQVPNR